MSTMTTTAPRTTVVLFDGHCPFCRAQAARLRAWAARGASIDVRDFQEPGALDAFPGLTHDDCMKAMRVVAPDGRVFAGAEAVARLAMTRAWAWPLAWIYYVPGLRALFDGAYAFVARRRYRIAKATRKITCDGTTCSIHFE